VALVITQLDLERMERIIAARYHIPYDRIDRVWLRHEALRVLRAEQVRKRGP